MSDGPSKPESSSEINKSVLIGRDAYFESSDLSWIRKEDVEQFKSVLIRSEREDGNPQDVRNSINFLEGLLERAKFPDDEQAKGLKTQIEEIAPRYSDSAYWGSSASPNGYDKLRRLRADYAGTIRGDWEGRRDRLMARESRMIENAKKV